MPVTCTDAQLVALTIDLTDRWADTGIRRRRCHRCVQRASGAVDLIAGLPQREPVTLPGTFEVVFCLAEGCLAFLATASTARRAGAMRAIPRAVQPLPQRHARSPFNGGASPEREAEAGRCARAAHLDRRQRGAVQRRPAAFRSARRCPNAPQVPECCLVGLAGLLVGIRVGITAIRGCGPPSAAPPHQSG